MDIRKIIRIHDLITAKQTGTPKELAQKLEISERTVFSYIAYMREQLNAPIAYDNNRSYYYESVCVLSFKGGLIINNVINKY